MILTDAETWNVEQLLDFWRRRETHCEQLEMFLAMAERVLTGKDRPRDRQVHALIAHRFWLEIGDIQPVLAQGHVQPARAGWMRVASLASDESEDARGLPMLLASAMERIAQDEPVDVNVQIGSTLRVYRFKAGQRTLIDRQGRRAATRVH